MYRTRLEDLKKWAGSKSHKPLIIRGARQVGKSTLVSLFAKTRGLELLSVNFEKNPEHAELFAGNDPQKTVDLLALHFNKNITPGKTLLFLDEIQATPKILSRLRYFYEEIPKLHIIAAGSLLDFELNSPTYSMPVGRISYMHLSPMGFVEFLAATGQTKLADFVKTWHFADEMPDSIHQLLTQKFKIFSAIGGMPEAVAKYAATRNFRDVEIVKQDLLATFYDDFAKYGKKNDYGLLRIIFDKVAATIGKKVKYSNLSPENRAANVAGVINLLSCARVVNKIIKTHANGIPLKAEENQKFYKLIFLDVGLLSTMLHLDYLALENADLLVVNKGALAEQWIGQALLLSQDYSQQPALHYWAREKKSSSAEVDFVTSIARDICAVEVKAGKTGRLKSLHVFMKEKKHPFSLRFNSEKPSLLENPNIVSLPLYFAEEYKRLYLELKNTHGSKR